MRKEIVTCHRFSEIDFIRLYCAMNVKNRCSPIINHYELEKNLYRFYSLDEFRELFQDICPKKDAINPENSYLDLGTALQTAQLFGLLTPIHGVGEIKSMISCDEDMAQEIISNADAKMVDKMTALFDVILNKKENISNAESVMNHFMEKLDSGDLTYDKEQPIGKEVGLDEEFIADQVKSYCKLLNSPILSETQGPKLVKKSESKSN